MKPRILLAAEGTNDGGDYDEIYADRNAMRQGIARVLVDRILGPGNFEYVFTPLTRLPKEPKKRRFDKRLKGDAGKASDGLKLAGLRFQGFIMVRDADRRRERLQEMLTGLQSAREKEAKLTDLPAVVGVAIETIEAWLLADPNAFKKALGSSIASLPDDPESLWGARDTPESKHPKQTLRRLLLSIKESHDTGTYERLASEVDLDTLKKKCRDGFAPFCKALESAFLNQYSA